MISLRPNLPNVAAIGSSRIYRIDSGRRQLKWLGRGIVFWKYRAARIDEIANRFQLTTRHVESIIPESLFRHTQVAD